MAKKVIVRSHVEFDEICYKNKWNDENVEDLEDIAFISIIGTEECQKYYLEEEEYHWFKENHPNVINLEFDDVEHDINWKGHNFKAMNDDDAKKLVKFIEDNIGKTFYIHCRAGVSRSGAIGSYIVQMYYKVYDEDEFEKDNAMVNPNSHVLSLLKREFYRKNGLFIDNNLSE